MIILYPITCLDHTDEVEVLKINIQNIEYIGPDPDDDDRSNVKMIGNDDWYQVSNEEAAALEKFIYKLTAKEVILSQHDYSLNEDPNKKDFILTEDMVQGSNYPNMLARAMLRSSEQIKKVVAQFGSAAVKAATEDIKRKELQAKQDQ